MKQLQLNALSLEHKCDNRHFTQCWSCSPDMQEETTLLTDAPLNSSSCFVACRTSWRLIVYERYLLKNSRKWPSRKSALFLEYSWQMQLAFYVPICEPGNRRRTKCKLCRKLRKLLAVAIRYSQVENNGLWICGATRAEKGNKWGQFFLSHPQSCCELVNCELHRSGVKMDANYLFCFLPPNPLPEKASSKIELLWRTWQWTVEEPLM